MKRTTLILLAVLSISFLGKAQSISIDSFWVDQDTLTYNDFVTYTLLFSKNDSSQLTQAEIFIMRQWNMVGGDTVSIITMDLLGMGPYTITESFPISPNQVGGGTNSLVIWPMIAAYSTEEGTPISIYIDTGQSISRDNTDEIIKIFPSPANSILNIKTDKMDVWPIRYQIKSISGQTLLDLPANSETLNLPSLAPGIYLLELELNKGGIIQRKIMVE